MRGASEKPPNACISLVRNARKIENLLGESHLKGNVDRKSVIFGEEGMVLIIRGFSHGEKLPFYVFGVDER